MKYITSKDALTGEEVALDYSDYGQGKPVVLIHGWPLSKEMWEYQVNDLVQAGYRVVKYTRRGFGKSAKPWDSYDYDAFADDLKAIMDELDLKDATLVGFSMGGGEVVRYLSRYGSDRVSKAVLISSVTPYMVKGSNNPEGVDESVFAEMMQQMKDDRIGFLDEFGKKFFGVNLLRHPVSTPLLEYYRMLAAVASPRATQQASLAFAQTDFRQDIESLKIPVLIIHGEKDQTVPIEASSDRTAKMIPHAIYKVYEGAPHGLFYTHREQLNNDLISFIGDQQQTEKKQQESYNKFFR